MVLIAATAGALVLMRPLLEEMRPLGVHSPGDALRLGLTVSVILEPMALTLTLAVGLLRLREPRPRLRRVFRQPGMAACMAVLSFIFINIFMFISYHIIMDIDPKFYNSGHYLNLYDDGGWILLLSFTGWAGGWILLLSFTGWAVSAAWIVLRLAGAWRAEPGWIDRTGRALGIYWILNSLVASPGLFF
jgi:hypothetical protein